MESRDRLSVAISAMRAHAEKHPEVVAHLKARGHTIESYAAMQCELTADVIESVGPWNPVDVWEALVGIGVAFAVQLGVAPDMIHQVVSQALSAAGAAEGEVAEKVGARIVQQAQVKTTPYREPGLGASPRPMCEACTDSATLICRCNACRLSAASQSGAERIDVLIVHQPARSCGIHRVIVGDVHYRTIGCAAEWHSAGDNT